jgi:hypothetical protein
VPGVDCESWLYTPCMRGGDGEMDLEVVTTYPR